MDETTVTAPAPTTDTTPTPEPATVAATKARDFGAFKEARRAERAGTPLPAVETEAKPATPSAETPESRQLSKRQQDANERTRLAVERATADMKAELDRLKAEVSQRSAAPKADTPPAPSTPEYKRILALPDAPKLTDFDGPDALAEHTAAVALFVAQHVETERSQRESAHRAATQAHQDAEKTITTFQGHIQKAGGKVFLDSLSPEVGALRPVEALEAHGQQAQVGPLNVLTSEIIKSDNPTKLLKHLSDHPDELARFAALRTPAAVLKEFGKLAALVDAPTPAAAPTKLVSSAPAPVRQVETRNAAPRNPEIDAVTRRDFGAYRAARMAARVAQHS